MELGEWLGRRLDLDEGGIFSAILLPPRLESWRKIYACGVLERICVLWKEFAQHCYGYQLLWEKEQPR